MKYLAAFIIILILAIWGIMQLTKNRKPLGEISNSVIIQISSNAFANNAYIPDTFTCDGDNVNPPLQFSGVPSDARSLTLILDDPDAPGATLTHWVIYNIPPTTKGIAQASVPPGTVAKNSSGTNKYIGPCPPSGTHTYHFKLYALDTMLSPDSVLNKSDLDAVMNGHIIEQAELLGKFSKK